MNSIHLGNCMDLITRMPGCRLIIADPPDNLGLKYDKYRDKMPDIEYQRFLRNLIEAATYGNCGHFWLSYYWRHDLYVSAIAWDLVSRRKLDWKKYIWRYTFGQHKETDCGSGFRYLLRISKPDAKLFASTVRQPSKRQTVYADDRANPAGRVPDDVWDFPRVTGNSKERRDWHPTQHPVAVYSRILRLCTSPGDIVYDAFGGTGTLFRANAHYGRDLQRRCLISEISEHYCSLIAKEHNIPCSTSVDDAWANLYIE